jgi:hypothetical protein
LLIESPTIDDTAARAGSFGFDVLEEARQHWIARLADPDITPAAREFCVKELADTIETNARLAALAPESNAGLPTFDTTTCAPLNPEKHERHVILSVLRQMRRALNNHDATPAGQEEKRLAREKFREEYARTHVPAPSKEVERNEHGLASSWPDTSEISARYRAESKYLTSLSAERSAKMKAIDAQIEAIEDAAIGPGPRYKERRPTAETAREFKNRQAVTSLKRRGDLPLNHGERFSEADYERIGFEPGDLDDDMIDVDLTFRSEVDVEGHDEWLAKTESRMAEAEKKRLDRNAKRKASADKAADKKLEALVLAIANAKTQEEADEARSKYEDHVKEQIKGAGKHQERKADIDRRHKLGFVHDGSRRVRGQRLEPFSEIFNGGVREDGTKLPEVVFRSQLAPALHRVMMCFPKRGAIWCGLDKTAVFRVYSKALALDYPYVVINQKMLGLMCVDLDGSFESEADLRRQLARYLTPAQMPSMAVGTWNKDTGRFENPHLIWILNDPVLNAMRHKHTSTVETLGPVVVKSERVVYTGSKGCRPGPIRTYHAVQRGLVHLLLPLGADAGCFNIYKIKNPLSPYWSTILLNEKNYHDLKPFFAMTWVDDDGKKRKFIGDPSDAVMADALRRAMIKRNIKVKPTHSNLVWSTIGRLIDSTLRFGEATQEKAYLEAVQDKNTLYSYLVDRVTPEAFGEFGNADVVTDNIHSRCQFTASRWEANKPARYNEGRDAAFEPVGDRTKPLRRTKARAKLSDEELAAKLAAMSDTELEIRAKLEHAGRETRRLKRERNTIEIAEEITRIWDLGLKALPGVVIKAVSASSATVYRLWDQALVVALGNSHMPPSYIVTPPTRLIDNSTFVLPSFDEGPGNEEGHHDDEASSEPWQATRAPELARNGQKPSFDGDAICSTAETLEGEDAPFSPDGSISVRRRGAEGFHQASPFETFDDLDAEAAGQSDGADWYDPITGEVRERDAPDVIYGEAPASDAEPADLAAHEDLADAEGLRSDDSHTEQARHDAETASQKLDGESLMDMLLASEGPSALDEAGDNVKKPEPGILSEAQQRAALAEVHDRVDALSRLRW